VLQQRLSGAQPAIIKKVPRALFRLELKPEKRSRQMLASMLRQHLSKRYGRVNIRYPLVQALLLMRKISLLTLSVEGKGIIVALQRKKMTPEVPTGKGEWRLLIDPFDASIPMRRMLSLEREYQMELRMVSDDLHSFLVGTPEVTALRWFFMGWDPMVPAVRSPAQLPWDVPSQATPA